MLDVLNGKYQIVREIARSNDIVYEARDANLGRRIALKELNLSTVQGQARRERIERFNREARAAGRLSHPNIVSIYESGAENDRYFIAMEFLEGQSLRDKIQVQGILPQREALDTAYQMLDALGYAHTNKVIHRDIKPDNIHILPGGHVKLTDFGIARLTEEPALTGDGQVFGTPSYMSPEQIEGRSIDQRSDLFSSAIVLYEMLTGRKPFTGDSVITITYAIMNAEPPPMNGVPTAIENTIRRALSKEPNRRPATAEQMRAELKNAEQSQTGQHAVRQPTNMGQQPPGYGLPPVMQSPPQYAQPAPPYQPPVNYPAPANYPLANHPAPQQQLPWQFNNGQQIPQVPQNPAIPPQLAQNPNAYMAKYRPPSEPIRLSPGQKTLLYSLLAALVIGGGLVVGVVAFLKAYEQYRVEASSQQISALIKQGETAFKSKDYAEAAKFYEQALAAKSDSKLHETIEGSLAACYIGLAQKEQDAKRLPEAKAWYDKALSLGQNENTDTARSERADLLERMGRSSEAQSERSQINTNSSPSKPPSLPNDSPTAGIPMNKDDLERPVREQARKLIDEGKRLYQKGDGDGAREKWREATGVAPGTPERDEAMQLLNSTQSAPTSGYTPDSQDTQ